MRDHVFCRHAVQRIARGHEPPRVGLKPTSRIQQGIDNKELTKNTNPVLSTGLDKIMQIYPELRELVKVWPELPEQVKNTIKELVRKHITEKK